MVRPHTPRAEARQTQRLALGFKATQRDVIPSHAKAFQGRQALPKPSHNRVAANQPKLVAGQFALAKAIMLHHAVIDQGIGAVVLYRTRAKWRCLPLPPISKFALHARPAFRARCLRNLAVKCAGRRPAGLHGPCAGGLTGRMVTCAARSRRPRALWPGSSTDPGATYLREDARYPSGSLLCTLFACSCLRRRARACVGQLYLSCRWWIITHIIQSSQN